MWVMTPEGFFSTTCTKEDPNIIQVRARKREHLEYLLDRVDIDPDYPGAELVIHAMPHRDYEYRVFIQKEEFGRWMKKIGETIDYDNFKNEAMRFAREKNESSEYQNLLHDIWHMGFQALGKNRKEYFG